MEKINAVVRFVYQLELASTHVLPTYEPSVNHCVAIELAIALFWQYSWVLRLFWSEYNMIIKKKMVVFIGWLVSRVFLLIEKSSRFMPSFILFIVLWMKIESLIFWWKPVCLPGHWRMKLGHFNCKKLRWWSRLLPLCQSLTVFSRSRNWSVLTDTKLRWRSQTYYHHHPLPQPKLDGGWGLVYIEIIVCVCVSGLCPEDIFWIAQPLVIKLGMVMHIMSQSVMG